MRPPLRTGPSLRGIWPAVVTPLDGAGAVDLPSLERLLADLVEAGVRGLTLLTYGGEGALLTLEERRRVLAAAREAGLPLIVGLHGSPEERRAVAEWALAHLEPSRLAFALPVHSGQDGLPPEVAEASVLAQEALGVVLDGAAVDALVGGWGPSLAGVKIEGQAMPQRLPQLVGRGVDLLTGWGGRDLAACLAAGAVGAIPVSSLARQWVEVHRRAVQGDGDGARRLDHRLAPLIRFMSADYPRLVAADKALLAWRGVIATPESRLPGARLTPEEAALLARLAQEVLGPTGGDRAGARP